MPPPPDWAPRPRLPYNGRVHRYIPHNAADALDGSFAMRLGGRWNPSNSFPVLYTSCAVDVAVANLWHKFEGEAAQPWEVAEEKQADLYELQIDQPDLIDAVTLPGLAGIGLPDSYPVGIGHEQTRPIGVRLHHEKRPGIWCRSAALSKGEEIALFLESSNRPTLVGHAKRLWEWFPVPDDLRPA